MDRRGNEFWLIPQLNPTPCRSAPMSELDERRREARQHEQPGALQELPPGPVQRPLSGYQDARTDAVDDLPAGKPAVEMVDCA